MRPAERAHRPRALTVREAVGGAASLVRFSALEGTLVISLAGVAAAATPATVRTVVLAVVIAVAFHVFAYVLNDVVDLPIDRTDSRRVTSPLVTELITPVVALRFAVLMLAVALVVSAGAGIAVLAAIVAAAIGLGAYDLLGKRTSWPPLADLVQGAGWGSLVLAGSWLGGGTTPLSVALAGFVVVFIVMANGVHGALRDLPNDTRHGIRTTASMLGAGMTADGARSIPRRVMGYAWALQVGLLVITMVAIVLGGSAWAVPSSLLAVILLAAATMARGDGDLLAAGMLHLLVLLAIPIALVVGIAAPALLALLVVVYTIPILTHGWLPGAVAWAGVRAADAGRYAADLVRSTRPHNALAAAFAVILGAHLGGRSDLLAGPVLQAALVAWFVVAAANVVNDRADVVEDRINRPTRPIASGRISRRAATGLALLLAAAAVLLAAALGPAPTIATLALIGLAFVYSSHLKGTFLVGNVVVAVLSASTVVFGAVVLARMTPAVAFAAVFILLSVASSEILKDTADRDGDQAAGRTTVATRLTVRDCLRLHTVLVAVLIGFVAVPSATGVAPPAFLVVSLVGVVVPQGVVLLRLRGATDSGAVRRVLPIAKLAWFTGLASLAFLI